MYVRRYAIHPHITSVWSSFDMYAEKYANDTLVCSVLAQKKFPWHEHGPTLLFPEYGRQMWNDFTDRLTSLLHCPLRNPHSLLMQILYQLYAGNRYTIEVPTADEFKNYRLHDKRYKKTMDQMVNALPRAYTVCVNDDIIPDNPEFISTVSRYVAAWMDQMYPERV